MSLKKKIVLSFLLSAFIIALLSAFLYLNFAEIKKETVFLELADTIRSRSLQLRRHEKNFLLYVLNQEGEARAIHETLADLEQILVALERNGSRAPRRARCSCSRTAPLPRLPPHRERHPLLLPGVEAALEVVHFLEALHGQVTTDGETPAADGAHQKQRRVLREQDLPPHGFEEGNEHGIGERPLTELFQGANVDDHHFRSRLQQRLRLRRRDREETVRLWRQLGRLGRDGGGERPCRYAEAAEERRACHHSCFPTSHHAITSETLPAENTSAPPSVNCHVQTKIF